MKNFILGVLKITAVILVVIISLTLLIWGTYAVREHRERVRNEPLAQPRTWPSLRIEALENSQVTFSTVWRDGRMSYQFAVDRYPRAARAARDSERVLFPTPSFTLTFLDKAGFKVFAFSIELNEIDRVVDAKGEGLGVSARAGIYVSAEDYRSAAAWNVTWNFGVQK
jgi:hypothetical protein